MWRVEPAQRPAEERERIVPGDGLIVRGAFASIERLDEPALRVQPEIRLRGQRVDRPFPEELAADRMARALVGHGFRAVFAELECVPFAIGRWPGAALTIKARLLVDRREHLPRVARAELLERDLERLGDGRESRRRMRRMSNLDVAGLDRWLSANRQIVPRGCGITRTSNGRPNRWGRLDYRR